MKPTNNQIFFISLFSYTTLWLVLLAMVLLGGCGLDPDVKPLAEPGIGVYVEMVNEYFPEADLSEVVFAFVDKPTLDNYCGEGRTNDGCNVWHKLIISDVHRSDHCVILLHEMGHSATKILYDDWGSDKNSPYTHDNLSEYFNDWIFRRCENEPR